MRYYRLSFKRFLNAVLPQQHFSQCEKLLERPSTDEEAKEHGPGKVLVLDLGAFPDTLEGHRQFGLVLGERTRDRIEKFITEDEHYKTAYKFVQTEKGREYSRQLLRYNEARFSVYMEELRGLAAGSKIPFEYIWVVNAQQELLGAEYAMSNDDEEKTSDEGIPDSSHGCSDVTIKQQLSHNEDGVLATLGVGTIVKFRFEDGKNGGDIIGFSYPGALPGWGPAASSSMAYTINFLFPYLPTIDAAKTPVVGETVALASREMAHSRSAVDVLERVIGSYLAYGQNVNISDKQHTFTIEVGPRGLTNLEVISDNSSHFHGNHYQRLPMGDDDDPRILRFHQLVKESPITILSDMIEEPTIFCTLPKKWVTICTVQLAFDTRGCLFKFWEHSGNSEPPKYIEPTYAWYLPCDLNSKK